MKPTRSLPLKTYQLNRIVPLAGLLFAGLAHAATITWSGSASGLWNTGSNWYGGTGPNSGVTVKWDASSALNLSSTLGVNANALGLTLIDPSAPVTVSGSAGTYLSIYAGGIDMSSATQDLTLTLPVAVNASQTWNVASGRTLTVTPSLTMYGSTLTLQGSGTLSTGGYFALGAASITGTINQLGGTWAPTYNGLFFYLANGTASSTYNLSGGTLSLTGGSQEIRVGTSGAGCIGTLNVTGGSITSSTNTTLLRVGYASASSGIYSQTAGSVTFGTINVASDSSNSTGSVALTGGTLNGTTLNIGTKGNGTLTVSGSGVCNLGGVATVGSATAGTSGTLTLSGSINLTTTSAGISKGSTGTIIADGAIFSNQVSGTAGGSVTISAPMILGANGLKVNPAAGSSRWSYFSGSLSGSGGFTANAASGSAVVDLSGSNTFTGGVTIQSGYLQVSNSNAIPVGSSFSMSGYLAMAADVTLGSWTGSGQAYALGTPRNLTVGYGDASGTYAGICTNLINLEKTGTGTQTFTGALSHTGGTTISGGTLQVGNGGTSGSLAGSIADNATLAFNRSDTLTVSGTISGTGALVQAGAGTLILTASNSYTGPTTVNSGILQIGTTGTSGWLASGTTLSLGGVLNVNNGTLNLNSGSVVNFTSTGANLTTGSSGTLNVDGASFSNQISGTAGVTASISANLVLGAGGLTITPSSSSGHWLTISGNVSGIGGVTFDSQSFNSFALAGSNSFTGGINVASGYFNNNSNNAIPQGAAVSLYGNWGMSADATLGSLTGNGLIFGNATNRVLTVGYGDASSTFAGSIASNNTLVKTGTGTLTLSGISTNTGGTTLNNGTLRIGNASALGAVNLTINAGTLDLNGINASVQALSGTGGLVTNSGTSTGTLTTSATSGISTYAGTIADGAAAVALTKGGAGTMVLTGSALTYTGTTTVTGGVLQLGDGTSGNDGLLSTAALVVNAQVRYNYYGDQTVGYPISNNGTVWHEGAATLTLTGSNTPGLFSILSGTLQIGDGTVGHDGSLTCVNGITNNSALVYNVYGSGTASSAVSGGGTLTKAGAGTLTVTGSLSHTGGTTISGGTLQIGNGGTSGSLAGDIADNATLAFNRSDSLTVSGTISGSGVLIKSGAGTLILTASNSYAGLTTVNAGTLQIGTTGTSGWLASGTTLSLGGVLNVNNGTLNLNSGSVVNFTSTGANLTTGSSGTLNIDGVVFSNQVSGTAGANVGISANLVLGAGGLTIAPSSGASRWLTLSGNISGSGGITTNIQGLNSTVLTGSNTFTGPITVSGGYLSSNGDNTIPNGATVYLYGSWGLGGNATIGCLAGTGQIFGSATKRVLTVGYGDISSIFAGTIISNNTLEKTGTGTLVITGALTHTGGTTISGGTLQIGNGGTTGSITGDMVDEAALIFNRSNALTHGGSISGGGTVTKGGSGTLTLSGSNSYSGGTIVNSGTLKLGNANALGAGGLIVNGGTVDLNGVSPIIGELSGAVGASIINGVSGTSTLTTTVSSGTATYAGNIANGTGALAIAKEGTGTLILSGSVTMAGLTVNGGTMQLMQSGSIAAVNIAAGATVALAAHSGSTYNVLDVSSLTLSGSTSTLDLWNNAMIVRASGTSENATNLAMVKAGVNAASNGLRWNGAGIGSTTALNEAGLGQTQALAVMVYDNTVIAQSSFEGVTGLGYFDAGTPVGFNQVLVKLTYLGDFNADGVINASDYTWLDGFALSGNTLGDLNGDGTVNATDYTWLDGSALNQSFGVLAGQLGGAVATPMTPLVNGSSTASAAVAISPEAVPEPNALGLVLTGALGLIAFRSKSSRRDV